MRKTIFTTVLLAACLPGLSQAPANNKTEDDALKSQAAANSVAYQSDLDFSYTYTSDWDVVDTKPMMPALHMQTEDKAGSDPEKRAAGCVQIGLLLRRGDPASVVMAISLPWECLGKTYLNSDLPAFGGGVAKGLTRGFDVKDPVYGSYKLGTHYFWIERMEGTSKQHPEFHRTIEAACTLLKKGAVCMTGLLSNDADSAIFEQSRIALEGEAATQLIPANAFAVNH